MRKFEPLQSMVRMNFFKYINIAFMIAATAGYLGWIWLSLNSPFHWIKFWIGFGYGSAFGCSMVNWYFDFCKFKELLESQARLRAALNSTHDSLLMLQDKSGVDQFSMSTAGAAKNGGLNSKR